MGTKKNKLLLLLILGCALFLRVYGLHQQGLFLFDEGDMVHRAFTIKAHLAAPSPDIQIDSSGTHSKGLWLLIIMFMQTLFPKAPYAINYVSAIFGVLTVFMTYQFAKKFYQSSTIGLLSALFLTISSYHVFYSRLALPESISTFFFIASIYFYFIGIHHHRKFSALSGVMVGIAFLTNRFRVGLLPIFILILEGYLRHGKDEPAKKDKWRYSFFLLSAVTVVFLWQALYYVSQYWGLELPEYFASVKGNFLAHLTPRIDAFSFLTYPLYLLKFEGWTTLTLLIISFFFIRKKHSPFLPLAIVALQIFVSSLIDEKCARSMSVVLPFLAIIYGVTLYNISLILNKTLAKRILLCVICLFIAFVGLQNTLSVLTFKSDMPKTVRLLNDRYPKARIVTTNLPMVAIYSSADSIHQLTKENVEDLEKLARENYELILIDPQKHITTLLSDFWVLSYVDLVNAIEKKCIPVIVADHFNDKLLERFLFEHTVHLQEHLNFLNRLDDDSGKIKVYPLDACLDALKK